jgi:hypothetical protein
MTAHEQVGCQRRLTGAGCSNDQDIPEAEANSRSMQENRIRRGQDVFGRAPFQEREDFFKGARDVRRASWSQRDPSAGGALDAIAEMGGVGRRRGGVIQRGDDGAGQRILAAEVEDGRPDRDAPGDYRNNPSPAKRWSTPSMSRTRDSARASSSRAMASAMSAVAWWPSQ